ncbi:uracil-DNA glycosylase family protein [Gilvimarinus sp. F26214L]|uniref:uracil-DNA glycosylase family protein n=1 Tax=Gilvimarinus sp. DZF01 TaxID=3461371 RepID=UPI0040467131
MRKSATIPLKDLLAEVRACRVCEEVLPLGANPVVRATASAKVLIVGQAPGTRVHATGVPWNDPSGDRLRDWMGLGREAFYDERKIAIIPMGFCYPGRGKSGDLPPRTECSELWHGRLLEALPNIELTLLVGSYAQSHYLEGRYPTLAQRVRDWRRFAPEALPLVHPSPRNRRWLKTNPWFEDEVVPYLRRRIHRLVG